MVNLGVLGFAHGHVNGIVRGWLEHPEYGVRVICGYDRDSKRLEEACGKHGIDRCDSAESLLSRSDIGAVLICAETLFHAELAVAASNAGKDIILYKPMALTLSQADSIVEAVGRNGVKFTVGWQMRVDPVNEKIRELISGGELGRLYYFRRRHGLTVHLNPDFKNTWHVSEKYNRDIFADDISHPVDWLYSLMGMPETVMCEMSTMHTPEIKNDTGSAVFKYQSGLIAEITFCASCSAAEITTECYFENGAIQQYGGDASGTRLPHKNTPSMKWFKEGESDWNISDIPLPDSQWERIVAQAKPLGEFLCGKRSALCSAVQARDSLRMVLACILSASEGRRVRLDDERLYGV